MVEEILLNNQGDKIKCIVNNDNVSFDVDEKLNYLKKLIHIHPVNDYRLAYIGIKPFIKINNNSIEKIDSITKNELMILNALFNHINESGKKVDIVEEFYRIKDRNNSVKENKNFEIVNDLISLANPIDLVNFCKAFEIKYPLNDKGYVDINNTKDYSYNEVIDSNNYENVIHSLDDINNRRELLKKCVSVYEEIMKNDNEMINVLLEARAKEVELTEKLEQAKKLEKSEEKSKIISEINKKLNEIKHFKSNKAINEVYSMYFDLCLRKNIKDKNCLISVSNLRVLDFISKKNKKNENVNYLIGLDTNKNIKEFNKICEKIESFLYGNIVLGVDLSINNLIDKNDLKDKLKLIIPVLQMHENSILKLNISNINNYDEILFNVIKLIDEINNEFNNSYRNLFGDKYDIKNIPTIRINYEDNINNNEDLIELINKYGIIIEFNKDDNINNLPTKFYDKNNIKYTFKSSGNKKEEIKIEKNEEKKIEEKPKEEKRVLNITFNHKRLFKSYADSLENENSIFGNLNDEMKVQIELDRIKKCIKNLNGEDLEYVKNRLSKIESYINNKDILTAKVMIYLLEKDKLNNLDITFSSVDYILNGIDYSDKFEVSLRKLYVMIANEYFNIEDKIGIRR